VKALIVEDSEVYRQILENVFGEFGYSTVIAGSSREALAKLEEHTFKLACLDARRRRHRARRSVYRPHTTASVSQSGQPGWPGRILMRRHQR